jgi:ERCC4-related helicase
MKYVHRPQLEMRQYRRNLSQLMSSSSPLLKSLAIAYHQYDILQDPYVVSLQSQGTASAALLQKVLSARKTSCLKQLRTLHTRASTIYEELGGWSAEWFVRTCLRRYLDKIVHCSFLAANVEEAETLHLAQIFASLDRISPTYNDNENISSTNVDVLSPKVEILLDLLTSEHNADVSGIIFVEQRATVFALAELLLRYRTTKSSYRTAPFVGMSNNSKPTVDITELADLNGQENTLEEFKNGERNLIVCTTVLEEGIDVPTCHLVICFDRPKNLKSFVQRRGRARKEQSKYIIFLDYDDTSAQPVKWQSLEETLKIAYEDDLRRVKEAAERERAEEENTRIFRVQSTG